MIITHDYPYLSFTCQIGEYRFGGSGYVDTGFDGGLVIPEDSLQYVGEPVSLSEIELGNGSRTVVPIYYGIVEIGKTKYVAGIICAGNEYLLGRQVIDNFRICFNRGKRLELEF